MAVGAKVQDVATGARSSGSSSLVVTLGAGKTTTVGNTLILCAAASGAGTLSSVVDSKGNVWRVDKQQVNSTTGKAAIASCVLAAALVAGDTITLTWSSSIFSCATVSEWPGALVADVTGGATGSGTGATSGAATAHYADSLAVAAWMTSSNTFSVGSGYTALPSVNSTSTTRYCKSEYQAFTSAASRNPGATLASGAWAGVEVQYREVVSNFPTSSVLDDCSGSPGTLWNDTGWYSTPTFSGGVLVGPVGMLSKASYGPEAEARCKVATKPTSKVEIYCYADDAVGGNFYGLSLDAAVNTATIQRTDNYTNVPLVSVGHTMANGNLYGIEHRLDGALNAWVSTDAGVTWKVLVGAYDTMYTGSQPIGFLIADSTGRLDDLGGGTITAPPAGPFLDVVGHSYAPGYGLASPTTERATALLAAELGAAENNLGVVGAAVTYHDESQGGWVAVANQLIRAGAAPYDAQVDYGVIWYGINDVAGFNAWDATAQAVFGHAMRFAISRMIAGCVFDESDASVTPSGGFGSYNFGSDDFSTGNTVLRATTDGAITIDVPSDFPGDTAVAVALQVGPGDAGSWTFTVDGDAAGTLDAGALVSGTQFWGGNYYAPATIRFEGLAAGAHTIVLSVTDITFEALFDSWWIEAPTPPVTLVVGQFKLSATGYASLNADPDPTDADVAALEGAIAQVVAEFPTEVKFVSLSSLDDTADVQVDELHPDADGHAAIAALMEAIVADTTAPTATVSSVTAGRISAQAGANETDFTLSADEAFIAYEIRAVPDGTSPQTAGTLIEAAAHAPVSTKDLDVTYDELTAAVGTSNETRTIKAFVRSAAGDWSD